MTTLTFTYTKADSSVSDRSLYVLVTPNTMYEGIDMSELSEVEQGMFIAEMEAARAAYLVAMEEVKSKFDLRRNYRRFDPAKMTKVVKE